MFAFKAAMCAAVTAIGISLSGVGCSSAMDQVESAVALTIQMKDFYRSGKYIEALPIAQ
jgi:hypothetical protein